MLKELGLGALIAGDSELGRRAGDALIADKIGDALEEAASTPFPWALGCWPSDAGFFVDFQGVRAPGYGSPLSGALSPFLCRRL